MIEDLEEVRALSEAIAGAMAPPGRHGQPTIERLGAHAFRVEYAGAELPAIAFVVMVEQVPLEADLDTGEVGLP